MAPHLLTASAALVGKSLAGAAVARLIAWPPDEWAPAVL